MPITWPVKKVYITQKWGINEDIYSRFGYKGHNGVDLRLFDSSGNRSSSSHVYAPHSGIIRERRFDADGYGNYLKLESDTEGSILGHLKEFKVNINTHVKRGDLIGIADNTGWSTGAHLHWGYYQLPRDRQNGYGGTIDPTLLIWEDSEGTVLEEANDVDKLREERDKNWNLYQDTKADYEEQKKLAQTRRDELGEIAEQLSLPNASDVADIKAGITRLLEVEEQKRQVEAKMTQMEKDHLKEQNELKTEMDSLASQVTEMGKERETLQEQQVKREEQLLSEINKLKSRLNVYENDLSWWERIITIFRL